MRDPADRPLVISAVPTAFDRQPSRSLDDEPVDPEGQRVLLERLRDAGVDGVFVTGTAGEFVALEDDERDAVLVVALEVFGPDRVWAHVGAATTSRAMRLASRAKNLGARNIAAVTPFYGCGGPKRVRHYYEDIADLTEGARLYAYLFEQRTGCRVTPDDLLDIAAYVPNLAGVKISGEPAARVIEFIHELPRRFEVFTGNDLVLPQVFRAGGAGVVSGASGLFPKPFVELAAALRRGDDIAAATAQKRVERVVAAVAGGDVGAVKTGLRMLGLPGGHARVPVDPDYDLHLLARTLRESGYELTEEGPLAGIYNGL